MLNRIRIFTALLLVVPSFAIETHFRTGVDFNILKMDIETTANISISTACPLPHITAEIRKPVDHVLDFGLSGSYVPILIGHENYHAIKVGMHSYLKYRKQNAIGLGIHIHHVPLSPIEPSLLGYLNNISLGLSMQGTLTDNLYTHFEVRQDFTPSNLKSWESYLASQNQLYALAPSMISFRYFSSSLSIGYILPSDN